VIMKRILEDNAHDDLRKQDICERNLAIKGKGLILAFLQSIHWDLDLQRRFINQWNECKFLKDDSSHSR